MNSQDKQYIALIILFIVVSSISFGLLSTWLGELGMSIAFVLWVLAFSSWVFSIWKKDKHDR